MKNKYENNECEIVMIINNMSNRKSSCLSKSAQKNIFFWFNYQSIACFVVGKKLIVMIVFGFMQLCCMHTAVFADAKRTFYPARIKFEQKIGSQARRWHNNKKSENAIHAIADTMSSDECASFIEDEIKTDAKNTELENDDTHGLSDGHDNKAVAASKVKLYTFYTPSHTEIKENYFLPSLQKYDDGIELIIHEVPQECPSGQVFKPGWQKAMLRKVDMIINAIEDNWGDIFIYSDIDIQYFGPISSVIKKALRNKDMVIQRDTPSDTMCAGFLACRSNEYTLQLFKAVRAYMIENNSPSDQKTLNKLLRHDKKNNFNLKWDYLPTDLFCGGGTFTASNWRPGKQLNVPRSLIMHHANWTTGITHKIAQLKYVKKKMREYTEKK